MLDPRIWLLAIGAFAIGTNAFVIAGILPVLAQDLGVSVEAAGLLMTGYSLTYALGGPVVAAIFGRVRNASLAFWSLIAFALATVVVAAAPNYTIVMVARVLTGLAAAVYSPIAYALAGQLAPPEQRGKALGIVVTGISASVVLGIPLGLALNGVVGWRAVFWAVAVISVVGAALLRLSKLPREEASTHGVGFAARFSPLAERRVLLRLAPLVLWGTSAFVVFAYLAVILGDSGHDQATVTVLLFVYGLGAVVGGQLGGYLTDRFNPSHVVLTQIICSCTNLAFMPLSLHNPYLAGASLFVWAVLGWSVWAPQQTRVVALAHGSSPNVLLALTNSVMYGAGGIGAAVGGALLPVIGAEHMPHAGAVILFGAWLLLLLDVWTERRRG